MNAGNLGRQPSPEAAPSASHGGTAGRTWLISFADLVSLLLTFMVMLFAQSDADRKQQWRDAAIAFARHLAWSEVSAPEIHAQPGPPRAPVLLDLNYLALVLPPTLASEPALTGARLSREADRLTLSIPATRLFAPSDPALTADGLHALASLARVLSGLANRLAVDATVRAPALGIASASGDRLEDQPGWSDEASDPLALDVWDAALSRAIVIAAALGKAGLGRSIGCRAVAGAPEDALRKVDVQTARLAAGAWIELVVFASAEE